MVSRDDTDTDLLEYPDPLPVFPLPGAVLLPGTQMPLHIFEERYRKMFADSLDSHGFVGMIQPQGEELTGTPKLFSVGCLGRIIASRQTPDGRYYVLLEGVLRFGVKSEIQGEEDLLYRLVEPDYQAYGGDRSPWQGDQPDRTEVLRCLDAFMERRQLSLNREVLDELADGEVVDTLAVALPFGTLDKQALLEAEDKAARYRLLLALLTLASFETSEWSSLPQ